MDFYCVNRNAQDNGDHEVHKLGCAFWPSEKNALGIGNFADCRGAVAAAQLIYPTADGCAICSPACHTS